MWCCFQVILLVFGSSLRNLSIGVLNSKNRWTEDTCRTVCFTNPSNDQLVKDEGAQIFYSIQSQTKPIGIGANCEIPHNATPTTQTYDRALIPLVGPCALLIHPTTNWWRIRGHKSFITFDRRPSPLVLERIVKSFTIPPSQCGSNDSNLWPWLWYHLSDHVHALPKHPMTNWWRMRGHKSFTTFDRRPSPLILEQIVKSLTSWSWKWRLLVDILMCLKCARHIRLDRCKINFLLTTINWIINLTTFIYINSQSWEVSEPDHKMRLLWYIRSEI